MHHQNIILGHASAFTLQEPCMVVDGGRSEEEWDGTGGEVQEARSGRIAHAPQIPGLASPHDQREPWGGGSCDLASGARQATGRAHR